MKSEQDPMLETDHLDELLEVTPPAQPVVVVQYRTRGVPSWVFVPLLILVPLGAIVVYHRMFVERYRVQAAQADSLLKREISNERARQPIVRNDPPPTTILPGSKADMSAADAEPFESLLNSPPATTVIGGSEPSKASVPATASAVPQAPAAGAPNQPAPTEHPATAEAVRPAALPEFPPTAPEKPTKFTMRSVLANPFADGNDAPPPPTPGEGAGSALTADNQVKVPAGQTQDLVNRPAQGKPGGQTSQMPTDKAPVGGAQVAMVSPVGAAPLQPLPTKEEADRQIREESARREAALLAQLEAKAADAQKLRIAEQLKFHQELGELIRTQGKKAGPDIEALSKRNGSESDPDKMLKANSIWRFGKGSQAVKVRKVRELEVPESVILGFLFDDIYRTAGGRNGPQNNGEVRVLAARQLLRAYPFVEPRAARPMAGGAGSGTPAARTSSPSRKSVVSSPR
jgi:hypothetical protein